MRVVAVLGILHRLVCTRNALLDLVQETGTG
jgi:hypothetical protein